MRVVVTGAYGQLGKALQEVVEGGDVLVVDLPEHDVTNPRSAGTIADFQPGLVIHGAAMTDVDGCERDPEWAFKVNAEGTRNVSDACRLCDAALLYVSTDYVFDGSKGEPTCQFRAGQTGEPIRLATPTPPIIPDALQRIGLRPASMTGFRHAVLENHPVGSRGGLLSYA